MRLLKVDTSFCFQQLALQWKKAREEGSWTKRQSYFRGVLERHYTAENRLTGELQDSMAKE